MRRGCAAPPPAVRSTTKRPVASAVGRSVPKMSRKPVPALGFESRDSKPNAGTGFLDIFGTLRPTAEATGLFVVDLTAGGGAAQPRRIGTFTGLAAPVWRDQSTIYGLAR